MQFDIGIPLEPNLHL